MCPAPLIKHALNYQSTRSLYQTNGIYQDKQIFTTTKFSKKRPADPVGTRSLGQSKSEIIPAKRSTLLTSSHSAGNFQDRIKKERKAHTMAPVAQIFGPNSSLQAKMFANIGAPDSNSNQKIMGSSHTKTNAEMTDDDTPIIVKVRYDPETGVLPSEDAVRKAVNNQILNNKTNKEPIIVNFFGQNIQSQFPNHFLSQTFPQPSHVFRPRMDFQPSQTSPPRPPPRSSQTSPPRPPLRSSQTSPPRLPPRSSQTSPPRPPPQSSQTFLPLSLPQPSQTFLSRSPPRSSQTSPPRPPRSSQTFLPLSPPQPSQTFLSRSPPQPSLTSPPRPSQTSPPRPPPQPSQTFLPRSSPQPSQNFRPRPPPQPSHTFSPRPSPQPSHTFSPRPPPQPFHTFLPRMPLQLSHNFPSKPHPFLHNNNTRPGHVPKPFINHQQSQFLKKPQLPNGNINSSWTNESNPTGIDIDKSKHQKMAYQQSPTTLNNQQALSRLPNPGPPFNEIFRPPSVQDIPELSQENLLNMLNQIPDLQGRRFNIEYAPPSAPEGYPFPSQVDSANNIYPEPVVIDKLPSNIIQHVKSSNNPALAAALEATIQQEQHFQSQPTNYALHAPPPTVMRHSAQSYRQVEQSRPSSSNDSDTSISVSSSETSSSEESDSEEIKNLPSTKPANNIPFVGPMPPRYR